MSSNAAAFLVQNGAMGQLWSLWLAPLWEPLSVPSGSSSQSPADLLE